MTAEKGRYNLGYCHLSDHPLVYFWNIDSKEGIFSLIVNKNLMHCIY